MSPDSIKCPCGATGWGKSHWLDTHTGRYEPACADCQDEGEIGFTETLEAFECGYRIPENLPATWTAAFEASQAAHDAADIQPSIAAE